MFKFLLLLTVATLVSTEDGPPPNSVLVEMFGDKFKIPESSVDAESLTYADCVDPTVYDSEDVLAEIDEESEYLCAFIAFQINKVEGEGLPYYADEAEATRRYPFFKKCVDDVKGYNAETDETQFEVNFFCDMSDEEKDPYASANNGDDSFGLGVGAGVGVGVGAPEKPPNSVFVEMFGDKFKIPESTVDTESLTLVDCGLASVYDKEEVLAEIDEESEYLCAFIAFQVNKVEGEGLPYYADEAEATKRYPFFKKCVDDVKGYNAETDETQFEVNFFCDMSEEEKKPYASHTGGKDSFGVGSGYDGGASETDGAAETRTSYMILAAALAITLNLVQTL